MWVPFGGIGRNLLRRFDALTRDPAEYAARVARECPGFPEGDFFPYTLAVAGYANCAVRWPALAPHARERAATLLELAVPVAAEHAGVAPERLHDLQDYGHEGVYLGQLALALGSFRLIGGTAPWERLYERLCDVLHEAFESRQGRPIASFPEYSWGFDSIPALLALHLQDRLGGTNRHAAVIARHLAWLDENARDSATGLPCSRVTDDTGEGLDPPRGCELSWRVALMAQLDRSRAQALYRVYVRHFWLERGLIAGFAEWPGGLDSLEDADSGPVLWGVGMSATGFGVGATLAAGDWPRATRLHGLLAARGALFPPLRPVLGRKFSFDSRYLTGMLMGDAAMFSSATWCDWGTAKA